MSGSQVWWWGKLELTANGYRVSFWDDENALKFDRDDECKTKPLYWTFLKDEFYGT